MKNRRDTGMIYYDHLPLDKDILKALAELSINYVFQPIFRPDGKTVYAWEALMRPTEMTVSELIEEYTKKISCMFWRWRPFSGRCRFIS